MRIPCPLCGPRDLREFTCKGAALPRPEASALPEDWDSFQHLRANPAGLIDEFWHHLHGCGAWLILRRDTTTHRIEAAWLASQPAPVASTAAQPSQAEPPALSEPPALAETPDLAEPPALSQSPVFAEPPTPSDRTTAERSAAAEQPAKAEPPAQADPPTPPATSEAAP